MMKWALLCTSAAASTLGFAIKNKKIALENEERKTYHHHHQPLMQLRQQMVPRRPKYVFLPTVSAMELGEEDVLTVGDQESDNNFLISEADDYLTSSSSSNDQQSPQQKLQERLKNTIAKCKALIWSKMYEDGVPGLVIAVTVNGKPVWKLGFGYSDLENRVNTTPSTVMRIASISKSITMALAGKLMEEGKLDLDKDIREYLPDWPKSGITARQLMTHTSGIRHYKKKGQKSNEQKEMYMKEKFKSVKESLELFKDDELMNEEGKYLYSSHGFTLLSAVLEAAAFPPSVKASRYDKKTDSKEEAEEKKPPQPQPPDFPKLIKKTFRELGLRNTYLDENEPLIYNRSRYYTRDKDHRLKNAPYVDNSYKWAAGGFVSTVEDLTKFGNAMLYSFQHGDKKAEEEEIEEKNTPPSNVVYHPGPFSNVNRRKDLKDEENKKIKKTKKRGYLKSETVRELWTGKVQTNPDSGNSMYGFGWSVLPESADPAAFAAEDRFAVWHTGGAIGASSVLFILPGSDEAAASEEIKNPNQDSSSKTEAVPNGVVVAIMVNMEDVGLRALAQEIALNFEGLADNQSQYKVRAIYYC